MTGIIKQSKGKAMTRAQERLGRVIALRVAKYLKEDVALSTDVFIRRHNPTLEAVQRRERILIAFAEGEIHRKRKAGRKGPAKRKGGKKGL